MWRVRVFQHIIPAFVDTHHIVAMLCDATRGLAAWQELQAELNDLRTYDSSDDRSGFDCGKSGLGYVKARTRTHRFQGPAPVAGEDLHTKWRHMEQSIGISPRSGLAYSCRRSSSRTTGSTYLKIRRHGCWRFCRILFLVKVKPGHGSLRPCFHVCSI